MSRLPEREGQRIDRSRSLSFSFDGRSHSGYAGDTIASALFASGRRVFSRSFKYHRPRGEICACGQCANSLVTVDGAPGVRACSEPLAEGMVVTHQNAWPSLRFDLMAATDRFGGPFTPPGFYYKTFIRPRRLWPLYEKVLRRAAGLGRLPNRQDDRTWETEYRRRHCDVAVLGGGAAGLSAALRAAEMGADVVLCDDDVEPGGSMLAEGQQGTARDLAARCVEAGVEILSRGSALGYFDGLVPIWQGDTLHQVRAARHVAATGAVEQPLVFPGNDLPGVMLSGGALRLAALYGLSPGESVVVATCERGGLENALLLQELGVGVTVVADLRSDGDDDLCERLRAGGAELLRGVTPVRANGRGRLSRVVLAAVDTHGHSQGKGREIRCDCLAVCGGAAPASSLLLQAGARASYDESANRFLPISLPDGVNGAGAVLGHEGRVSALLSGSLAGAEAAFALGLGAPGDRARAEQESARLDEALATSSARLAPPAVATYGRKGKAFVDLDEDVTAKDVAYAADEGYDSIELSKRYTTATMGPSQGRFSQLAAVRALAQGSGLSMGDVGLTTARPPWSTVPLGVLAGRPFEAAKRSALQGRHRELGATVNWAGDWRRAYDYGDPVGEALAVQEDAGLIDVSTLGKLIVRGPEATEFLDRLYPNRMSSLQPGRIRYGILTSEAGRITDDGTVCRLDEETFYVTTTSSGAARVEQWFSWWLADWRLDVSTTDVTQGVAAMNLAGPRSREILSGLSELDCSNEAFPYLDGQHGEVAGVPCLLLRIGFTGELGYELHCPLPNARQLWDAIAAAGARPFGLEPQRILRLQKHHILVGQDTDSESTPYGANLAWAVKLDKEQAFIGRWALEEKAEAEPPHQLVGFTCPGGEVPTEGAAIVSGGAVTGQVTSARLSPKLGQSIGLAMVAPREAVDGAAIEISDRGRRLTATITTTPFYDPKGEVVRS
jgi:sarcosine oxidase, subunit alpha